MCVARFKMAHFKIYEGGQKPEFLSVCVVVHFTCFLGGPSNGIKRVDPQGQVLLVGGLGRKRGKRGEGMRGGRRGDTYLRLPTG